MTLREAEKMVNDRWMALSVEERIFVCGQMYEAEKAILEHLAPKHFTNKELSEFVFFHMHGMTIEESIAYVPESVP